MFLVLVSMLQNGEIDIIEGVHDNIHNQVAWHTESGCSLTNDTANFTGTVVVRVFHFYVYLRVIK